MKTFKSYIVGAMALAAAVVGLPACQDHFDDYNPDDAPVASMTANSTIAEIKSLFWDDNSNNYCTQIPARADGSHYIVSGRVTSSDYAGNCFKYIVLQDATGSLNFSINSYNLYLNYRRGQEIVVDLTGLYAGKYRGLFQIGFPSFNSSINGDETSFMAPEYFRQNVELNGWPEVAKVDTVTVGSFSELGTTPAELQKWQSTLVRFNNVEFVPNATTPTLSTYHSSGVTQQIKDAAGNTLDIRTSGYANFWNQKLPEGRGDVVALLGYYINLANSGGWQLTLLDAASLMNFGNPTIPEGSEEKPYDVLKAIALQVNSSNVSGWVKGYIVGTVAPEVTEVKSNADIDWGTDPMPTLNTTLVIGQSADTRDIAECLVIALPAGSSLRANGALRENPDNLGRAITLKGTFAPVLGTYGITGNNGTPSEYKIEGKEIVDPDQPTEGDGTEAKPFNCAQIIALNPSSTTEAVKSGVWVSGYIVGYYQDYNAHFEVSTTQRANILISDVENPTDKAQCVCIQLVAQTDTRNALNLVDNPGVLGKKVQVFGDIMKYNTLPGVKNTSNYKLDGSVTPPTPPAADPVTSINENFASAIPANWSQVQIAGNKTWFQRTFNGVGYASMTGYNGTAPFDQWLVTPPVDMSKVTDKKLSFRTQVNGYGSTTSHFEVYVMTQADTKGTNTKLNPVIATAPASGYSDWAASGDLDLSAFTGTVYIGFRYHATTDANYATWCVTDIKLNASGTGGDEPVNPPVTSEFKGDFDSFNGGAPKASPYGTYTNATGWTATNAIILGGQESGVADNNPRFGFIGGPSTIAPTIKGTQGALGSITSPTLTGGIKTLTFKYGFAFTETKAAFTVQVLQGGNVAKEQTVTIDKVTKLTALDFSMDVNLTGDFQIVIKNDGYSGATTGNKDRLSVWNLTWTN